MRWPPIYLTLRVVTRPPSRSLWHCIPSSASIFLVSAFYDGCPFLRLHRLLGSRSRWAGYLQSLPAEQNWDGIALFWDFTSRDVLSSHSASDGHRTELEGLDFDGDAVEAIQWLNGTEAQKHFVLSGELRAPILVRPSTAPATGTGEVEGGSMTNTPTQTILAVITERNFRFLLFSGSTDPQDCRVNPIRERVSACLRACELSCIHGRCIPRPRYGANC